MRLEATKFADIVCQHVPGTTFELIERDQTHIAQIQFAGPALAKIKLYASSGVVGITEVRVSHFLKRTGYARRFTQSIYNAAEQSGFEKLEVFAIDEGRFAWLALGFTPTQTWWRANLREIRTGFEKLRQDYPEAVTRLLDPFLVSGSPHLLPALANLQETELGGLRPRELAFKLLEQFKSWNGELEIGDELNRRYLFAERR